MKTHLQWGTGELERRRGGQAVEYCGAQLLARTHHPGVAEPSVMDGSQVRAPGHACSLVSLNLFPGDMQSMLSPSGVVLSFDPL